MGSLASSHDENLDIVIVGGGIGGLAAAVGISQALNKLKLEAVNKNGVGLVHKITVLERHSTLREVGAGIQIPPNASGVLSSWGLRSAFEEVATTANSLEARRYDDDTLLVAIPQNINDYVEKNYGAPHYLVHRADYQSLLAKAALKEGVEIKFNQRVVNIDVERNEVVLEGDERISADLIVAADGIYSKARKALTVNDGIEPFGVETFCFRFLVPVEKMRENSLTAKLVDEEGRKRAIVWSGPNRVILCYPVSANRLYNVVATIPKASDAPVGIYNEPGDPQEMRDLFQDFNPTAQALLSHAGPATDGCAKWTLADMQELKSWRSESGGMVLLGDAAHNMLPWASSGASTSIEDASVLALCLSHFLTNSEKLIKSEIVAKATSLYEHIRRPRTTRMQEISRDNATAFVLPDGPVQQARDKMWKAMQEEQDRRLKEGKEIAERNLAEPNMSAKYPHPSVLKWMSDYDVPAVVSKALQETQ